MRAGGAGSGLRNTEAVGTVYVRVGIVGQIIRRHSIQIVPAIRGRAFGQSVAENVIGVRRAEAGIESGECFIFIPG